MFADPNSPQGRYSIPHLADLNTEAWLFDVWERYYFRELNKYQFEKEVRRQRLTNSLARLKLHSLGRYDAIDVLEAWCEKHGL